MKIAFFTSQGICNFLVSNRPRTVICNVIYYFFNILNYLFYSSHRWQNPVLQTLPQLVKTMEDTVQRSKQLKKDAMAVSNSTEGNAAQWVSAYVALHMYTNFFELVDATCTYIKRYAKVQVTFTNYEMWFGHSSLLGLCTKRYLHHFYWNLYFYLLTKIISHFSR